MFGFCVWILMGFLVLRRVFGSSRRRFAIALCLVVFFIVLYSREALVVPLRVKLSK